MDERCKVTDLVPNSFNPNELTSGQFTSLVHELRQAGINKKAVRYRLINTVKEIIDGEQTWRAAIEAGLSEVLARCEQADEYEARRLCVRANHGGQANPLKMARLIAAMIAESKKTHREIAKDLGVTEGTVRNRLIYLELAEKAATDKTLPTEAEIAALSVRQVRELLDGEDEGAGDEAVEAPGPIAKAKKIVAKMTAEQRQAFTEWLNAQ